MEIFPNRTTGICGRERPIDSTAMGGRKMLLFGLRQLLPRRLSARNGPSKNRCPVSVNDACPNAADVRCPLAALSGCPLAVANQCPVPAGRDSKATKTPLEAGLGGGRRGSGLNSCWAEGQA